MKNKSAGVVVDKLAFSDLPDDMQVLIGQFAEDFAPDRKTANLNWNLLDSLVFSVREMPTSAFPVIPLDEHDRGESHALEMMGAKLPPVLVYGSAFLDGRHRLWLARKLGSSTVRYIDLKESGQVYNITNDYMGSVRNTCDSDDPDIRSNPVKIRPESAYDPRELKTGIKVELEHTDDPRRASVIARQHLTEFPDYYTRLTKMEDRARRGLKPNPRPRSGESLARDAQKVKREANFNDVASPTKAQAAKMIERHIAAAASYSKVVEAYLAEGNHNEAARNMDNIAFHERNAKMIASGKFELRDLHTQNSIFYSLLDRAPTKEYWKFRGIKK